MTDVNFISRDEIDGIAMIQANFRTSKPIRITYDNIVVHGFSTGLQKNPRPAFDEILEFARAKIDGVMSCLEQPCKIEQQGDNWTIVSRFLKIQICLHCHTFYDCSEFVFEDTAHHRVSISVAAGFDTKYVYRHNKYNEEVFQIVNKLYCNLFGAFY